MRTVTCLAVAIMALAGARPAPAQQIETPVAFDSAGKVRSLTPQLVERYGLTAPVWPVTGSFVEARMYALSGGGQVLSVERPSGAIERFPLSDQESAAIRQVIDAAMTRTGATPVEARPTVISEPARNAFARNQMLLSLGLYGPLLASLADDGQTGTALYLLGAGSAFFVSLGTSREIQVTRAQNHLATDGALRGYGSTAAFLYASGADVGQKTYSALGLAGALGGSILGYRRGKGMTDAEAEAATTLSTLAAAAGFGATTAITGFDDTDGRAPVGTMLGAGIVGYALGPAYPRGAPYTVTRGDVQMLSLGAILGTAVAFVPVIDEDIDEQVGFGALTAGLLAGAYVADRTFVRDFDYSMSEATQIQLATAAGGAMGGALAVLAEPPAKGTMALITGGAIVGAMVGHAFSEPLRASGAPRRERSTGAGGIRFDPAALALAAARSPGTHAVLTLKF